MMLSIVAPALSVDAVAQTSDTVVTEDRVYHRYAEVKYEAENAQVAGADIATNHTGYSDGRQYG